MGLKYKKQIFDSIHGYVGVTELELAVIDHPLMQRLRHISQLGAAYFVYPGATHTRFSHSIGTMFMIHEFLLHVRRNGELLAESDETMQKMRLVGLLHDIGHYPLSHTFEHEVEREFSGKSHTAFGGEIIKRFISEKISTYHPGEIIDMINGRSTSDLGMLISSAFDADKSDYLLRDAYHAGVPYGRVHVERLINTMSMEGRKIIFEKNEAALENFLLGRYHMFRSVYYHKTVTSFNLMAGKIFAMLVKEGYMPHPKDLLKDGDELDLLNYTDHLFFTAMNTYYKNGKDKFLRELIRMFMYRKPLSAAYFEPKPFAGADKSSENLMIKRMAEDESKKRSFAESVGVDPEWVFPTYLRPLGLVDEENVLYIKENGEIKPLSDSNTLILSMIGKKTLYDARLYTKKELVGKVKAGL